MAPCRVFKYYKNIYCSKNLAENPEKFWLEYSNRLVGLGQVASLTKSGQEPPVSWETWRTPSDRLLARRGTKDTMAPQGSAFKNFHGCCTSFPRRWDY